LGRAKKLMVAKEESQCQATAVENAEGPFQHCDILLPELEIHVLSTLTTKIRLDDLPQGANGN
jgi:hypothetical protein